MSDLTLLMKSNVELIELIKEKDVKIKGLRIYAETLQHKKLELLDRVLEQRKSFNLRTDCHEQETHFLQEEVDTREDHINKLEKELRSLRARVS